MTILRNQHTVTTKKSNYGAGLGLRYAFIDKIAAKPPLEVDFFEVCPENYINRGGRHVRDLNIIAEHSPILAHGLSLSIGSTDPLDWNYLKQLKAFLNSHKIPWFTDHLCFASQNAHQFHDLLPLPMTKEAANHVSERARIVQDFLEMPFGLENVSFYMHPAKPEMTELEFIQTVLHQSGCSLLLDINNLYVNSVNHGIDANHYINELAKENILHIHIAGHSQKSPDLIIDTHGSEVSNSVWSLLRKLSKLRPLPSILIERDNNIPDDLSLLFAEVEHARQISQSSQSSEAA